MKVLVTGASGFLGRGVVRAVLASGHDVVAMVRPTSVFDARAWPGDRVSVVRGDLRQAGPWQHSVGQVDAIVHLAAAATGDLATQFGGTVVATENLLASVSGGRVRRFVHVSSFSVYDYDGLAGQAVLDEKVPLEAVDRLRDPYTATKLLQEQLVREACSAEEIPLVVVRPGAIFGPGKDWSYGAAMRLGGFALVFAPRARFRLTFIDNCAEAVARSIDAPLAPGRALNVVDDDLPTHAEYFRSCRAAGARTGRYVPVPWVLVATAGKLAQLIDRYLLGGRAKLPEFADRRRQLARWKPLQYSNAEAKKVLDWVPATSIDRAVRLTVGAGSR